MVNAELDSLRLTNAQREAELERTKSILALSQRLGRILDRQLYTRQLVSDLVNTSSFRRALVLTSNDTGDAVEFGAISDSPPDDRVTLLKNLYIRTDKPDEPTVRGWLDGAAGLISADDVPEQSGIRTVLNCFAADRLFSVPLQIDNRLIGALLLDHPDPESAEAKQDQTWVLALAPAIAVSLENARLHSQTVDELDAQMRELTMMRQIDRELSEKIDLVHVFDMTLDWALRFTCAQAASLALYAEDSDELRYVADVGYELGRDRLAALRSQQAMTIAQRVARAGRVEVIPDVSDDPDYVCLSPSIGSQLCTPVVREDHVIAVIVIESKHVNGFNDEHVAFVAKLAARAGIAIDNGRLFAEVVREREKLARILSNTADVVMVVNEESRIDLINDSAVAALRLKANESTIGRSFEEVFKGTPLVEIYRQAVTGGTGMAAEIALLDARAFHAILAHYEGIGWIIVLHDISPLKAMDYLKNELVMTVSHDLKQPLSVMHGYTELLLMRQWHDAYISGYTRMIQRSIANMRALIDDLLDLAKVESGAPLQPEPVLLRTVIDECIETLREAADLKTMDINVEIAASLPAAKGERGYLYQIFVNLISNAVKYTPPQGSVHIQAEQQGNTVRIAIRDTGMCVSPEDQPLIFDLFYRVRRPETDNIDGTGLGLAIVKRLVDLHDGQISVESRVGEGSTFTVTLPIFEA